MATAAQALLDTPLGALLSAGEAADLAQAATTRTIPRGQALFRTGDRSASLYVVLAGSLDVVLGPSGAADAVVASLGPGQLAGELEIMTQSARVASLIATEDATVLEIAASRFDEMLKASRPAATKLVVSMARVLARRLAAVNQRLVSRAAPTPASPAARGHVAKAADPDVAPAIDDADLAVLDKLWGS